MAYDPARIAGEVELRVLKARIAAGTTAVALFFSAFAWREWYDRPEQQLARTEAARAKERSSLEKQASAFEQLEREEIAALHRSKADCQATAIEAPRAADFCWRAHEVLADLGLERAARYRKKAQELRDRLDALGL